MLFIYWRMGNGHEHSYWGSWEDYATRDWGGSELNQRQYMEYIERHERTYIDEIVEIEVDELTDEFARYLLEKDYIASYENGVIEFY